MLKVIEQMLCVLRKQNDNFIDLDPFVKQFELEFGIPEQDVRVLTERRACKSKAASPSAASEPFLNRDHGSFGSVTEQLKPRQIALVTHLERDLINGGNKIKKEFEELYPWYTRPSEVPRRNRHAAPPQIERHPILSAAQFGTIERHPILAAPPPTPVSVLQRQPRQAIPVSRGIVERMPIEQCAPARVIVPTFNLGAMKRPNRRRGNTNGFSVGPSSGGQSSGRPSNRSDTRFGAVAR